MNSFKAFTCPVETLDTDLHGVKVSWGFVHQVRPPQADVCDFEDSSRTVGRSHTPAVVSRERDFHSGFRAAQHGHVITDQP